MAAFHEAVALPDLAPEPPVRSAASKFVRRHPLIVIGGSILSIFVLAAIFAPYAFTVDPNTISPANRLAAPSAGHWLGTDMLGRDLYSRIIYGSRVSLIVGLSVAFLSAIVGMLVGTISGFISWLDPIIMRIMDGMMAIPQLLLAIAMMALTGPSVQNVIIAITLPEVPRVARLSRSVVLSLRRQTYVEAAMAAGSRLPKILFRHILPNALPPMLVQLSYICASAMIVEAILSFIGAGAPPTIPSWGNIMAEGKQLWQVKPYLVLFPAMFLSVVILAVNLLGDGLRDALDSRS
ncbi:ABC transporter permease [Mesorhizobium sp.]|uniref:ABC transporter permease n=1 Tax=Mesorhizobium sp. TaxID=1871066 RepID=UPI000FE9C987|nr:ABC transporter permease [Mesorhizobium sp.]RWJ05716.1 MAG: ABC transporter permease [Mesorhizobium sp.]